jgi:transcription factor C subunit 7
VFQHPSPATLEVLQKFFPRLIERTSLIVDRYGEGIDDVHDRVAYVLARIIADVDAASTSNKPESIIISTHAATLIALGRALTGQVPQDLSEPDFDTFTCSVSTYKRREVASHPDLPESQSGEIPRFKWKNKGVAGGWDCVVNASVDHLTNGGERNW